jgi:high frequency lysogenization protein
VALAGVFQAAHLVTEVASRGLVDATELQATLGCVFVSRFDSVDEVYGGPGGVSRGLQVLIGHLVHRSGRRQDREITRYVVGLLHLERRLRRHPEVLERLRQGVEALALPTGSPAASDPRTVADLAELYLSTVSTLGPRIMVRGEPEQLARPGNAERIRALLLSGLRSAVLWRWCGGSRVRLLLGRGQLVRTARAVLEGA